MNRKKLNYCSNNNIGFTIASLTYEKAVKDLYDEYTCLRKIENYIHQLTKPSELKK